MKKVLFWICFLPGCFLIWFMTILTAVMWMITALWDYTECKMSQFEDWCFDRNKL